MDEDDWIPLGATDLGSGSSLEYDPETGEITGTAWSRVAIPGKHYPPGTPTEDVLRDLLG